MIELIKNDLRDHATVLDMGTGTGEIPLAISGHVSKVEAIDYSEQMIEAAKKKSALRGIGNVIFRVQDCHQLHYDDGTFDAVIAANTLHVVPQPEKVLAEAHRVLRDEGTLLAPTFVHNESFRTKVISWILSKKGHPIHTKFDSELLRAMIDRNGFKVIRQELLKNIMPVSYIVAQKD